MRARNTPIARLVAAVATIAGVLAGCSDATSGGEASARGSGEAPSTSAQTPPQETQTAGTRTPSGVPIVGEIPEGSLEPGLYALPPIGPLNGPFAVVDVPAGYGSWATFIEADEPAEPAEDPLMLGLWVVTGVYLDPCAESNEVSPTSVPGTAEAFVRQRLTSTTRPREVDLAGYRGLYMEVTTPTHLDYSRCDDAEVNLWEGRPEGGYWTRQPGMVERLWILAVDGQPMVIALAVPPSATRAQIDAVTDMVEAATFERAR